MQIPKGLLQGKKILLAVSGSIAAYKAVELARLFYKASATVRVVMTPSATKFVTPLTFEAISGHKVLLDGNEEWSSEHNHIGLATWADIVVVAPASANTIAKLANAIADNALLAVLLAFSATKILAPSANSAMISNPLTKANLKLLAMANYEILSTQVKELVCRTSGEGAMAEPLEIFYATSRVLLAESFWQDRGVVVSGGGTIEAIDDVRYFSNFSSGKMASELARALYLKGADVTLVATRHKEDLPQGVRILKVQSSAQMLQGLNDALIHSKLAKRTKPTLMHSEPIKQIQKRPYLFMAAAVSDYIPKERARGKLKKQTLGSSWRLELQKNIDILQSLERDGVVSIGFKAEMDPKSALQNAKEMLSQKRLDAVCLNLLKDANDFGKEESAVEFITKDAQKPLGPSTKLALSFAILQEAKALA